tara:strand:+ start:96 stop:398 length:303 start_codon:yes stop_codon:yes gene_type:complete
MPANKKYLTSSKTQRFAKISAGILGGYLVTIALHLALATWLPRPEVLITSTYSCFIMWVVLMILPFLAKNGWKVWGIYILLLFAFALAIYFGKSLNPLSQ